MPKWTTEQQMAIDEDGKNIIVSAGAGSGKTAVLSERVIRKLEQGVNINQLLVLTFTKAAAFEMMIRIRDKIKERPHLKEQLSKIDVAYITTFDSFSLSLVKKYHYLLGIKRDIKVMDQNIMNIEKIRMLDEIFDRYYKCQDSSFFQLLKRFTLKDDPEIKKLILTIYNKLELKYDKKSYLQEYINAFFEDKQKQQLIYQYEQFLLDKIELIRSCLEKLSEFVDGDYLSELEIILKPLLESKNYDEIKEHNEVKLKNLPRGSCEEAKALKEQLSSYLKEIKDYLYYQDTQEIWDLMEDTKESISVIIQILLELDCKIQDYKKQRDAYEFSDISKMAIRIVRENSEIQQELKYSFNEIMVDEYQDTSDLQEEFISQIENHNVYMVGDIKQSIYRFRNANPYIFKTKYDRYGRGEGGFKIDLMKNFRSRKEVLANINYIFNDIMDDVFGGCRYQEEHQMIFGNLMYEANRKSGQNSNFEVYNYHLEKGFEYTKDEVEAFLVLQDIQEKIDEHYQVVDKKTSQLRDCTYGDFTILMDRATKFELYKKIFEYKNVPLAVYKDTSITKEDDIYILSNLLKLIYLCYHQQFDEEFRYTFLAVARSYLTDDTDPEIFEMMENNRYFESALYQKIKPILKEYYRLNGVLLLEKVVDTFEFYKRQILVGQMEHLVARVSYLKTVFEEMDNLGYSLDEEILNFYQMVQEGYDIKVSLTEEQENAVKIMTIHKSKGLEFPILYMTGLSNKFNIRDLNEKFLYDESFGIVIPFYSEQEIPNISKVLMKDVYIKEEISEKIRLFYVALTRAKEKMILITCNEQEEDIEEQGIVSAEIRYRYRSFLDILKSIWGNLGAYRKDIDLSTLSLTRDYNFVRKSNYQETLRKSKEKIHYEEVSISNEELEQTRFSKTDIQLFTPENYQAIELGKKFHTILENLDFVHPNLSFLSSFEKNRVEAFLKLPILKSIETAKIYKEYEFLYQEDGRMKHGIIDLLVEYSEKIILLDYKLKQTKDAAYVKQLKGYMDYIRTKTTKPIEMYLYSILDEKLMKIS